MNAEALAAAFGDRVSVKLYRDGKMKVSGQSSDPRGETRPMITIEEVIGMGCLTEAEVAAIAEHEHMPDLAAAVLAVDFLEEVIPRVVAQCGVVESVSVKVEGDWRAWGVCRSNHPL